MLCSGNGVDFRSCLGERGGARRGADDHAAGVGDGAAGVRREQRRLVDRRARRERDGDRDSNVIDVLISRIRRKLGVPLIHTVRGVGYVLRETPP